MLPAPIPHDDAARLRALHQLKVLDTPSEQRFDRIVQFAASEFEMPIVLLSLVDQDRQWFKAKLGLDAEQTARAISFSGHAIACADLLIIEDAASDPRFADNPLVTGAPHVRFYCGAPLRLRSGAAVGSLCLIDSQPRQFGPLDQAILIALRELALAELEQPLPVC